MGNNLKSIFVITGLVVLFSILGVYFVTSSNSTEILNFPTEQEVSLEGLLEENGGLPINIQDQTTRIFDISINQIENYYTLATEPTINTYSLTLTDVTGLSNGDKIAFLEQNGIAHIYFAFITGISSNTITLNEPIPYNYNPSETTVFSFNNQLNVDGSTTPEIFSLINYFDQPVDITRIIFRCNDNVVMHDGLFCGETQLTNGITFRKYTKEGYYINYFNIRNNAKWGLLAYDLQYTDSGKPPDSTYGFGSRLTFAGQNKHGAVIRLEPNERIELVIHDDLTDITGASLMVEGHFTQD